MKTSRLIFLFTVINLIGAIVFIAYLPERETPVNNQSLK